MTALAASPSGQLIAQESTISQNRTNQLYSINLGTGQCSADQQSDMAGERVKMYRETWRLTAREIFIRVSTKQR